MRTEKKTITLFLTKSSVTIYGVTCDTFVDVSPSYVTETNGVKSGTIGFYDETGFLNTQDVEYTLSSDTAQNARASQSITFPRCRFPLYVKARPMTSVCLLTAM